MSLIVCPECGKEYSDKALCCPCCACPTKVEENALKSDEDAINLSQNGQEDDCVNTSNKQKRRNVPLVILGITGGIVVVTILLIVIINIISVSGKKHKEKQYSGIYAEAYQLQSVGEYLDAKKLYDSIPGYKDADMQAILCNAEQYCSLGNYLNAYEILKQIPDYDETKTLLTQIYYETRVLEGLNEYRGQMKNPNSLQINSVKAYYSQDASIAVKRESPYLIVHTSGQNGLGGYSLSFVLLIESETGGVYESFCCSDIDEPDDSYEYLVAEIIKKVENEFIEMPTNVIDFKRLTKLIDENNYLAVDRIPELRFDDIVGGLLFLESKCEY